MSENQLKASTLKEWTNGGSDFKVIEYNVADPTETLYAVVTPIKNTK